MTVLRGLFRTPIFRAPKPGSKIDRLTTCSGQLSFILTLMKLKRLGCCFEQPRSIDNNGGSINEMINMLEVCMLHLNCGLSNLPRTKGALTRSTVTIFSNGLRQPKASMRGVLA